MKNKNTTIQISFETLDKLKELKIIPRETYEAVIIRLIDECKKKNG